MIHRVLLTALYGNSQQNDLSYYCASDPAGKSLYCDAFTAAEAGCKFILSFSKIDEVIIFGKASSCFPGEEAPCFLRKGMDFYPADISRMSAYCQLQYRLEQFFGEVNADSADYSQLLNEDERKQTVAFLRRFFREKIDSDGSRQFARYFHYLIQDIGIQDEFTCGLRDLASGSDTDFERYRKWVLQYLYTDLKATSKFEPMEENNKTRIRFLTTSEESSLVSINDMMTFFEDLEVDDDVPDSVELYICLQNDHVSDMFSILNTLDLTRVMPKANISIKQIVTDTKTERLQVRELRDKTEEYSISELLSGIGAFLRYGKTDMLVEYWKRAGLDNPKIDKVIYAMRNIDSGISLCDITDIERGLKSLRSVIKNDLPIGGETAVEKYFELVVESIRHDYGMLLEQDQIPFIDLVKWAYKKGFWQQTLTLIESRAPRDFVDKGIFFYSDGEKSHKQAVEILGKIYYDLKPFEKYKLNDISHYYIKYYNRWRAPRLDDGNAYQMGYAATRMNELETKDNEVIRAHTVCPDRDALKELLFAYYHLSDVRNITNHAADEFGGFYSIMEDDDLSERMTMITKATDYFIHCYDLVNDLVKDKEANIVKIDVSELTACANRLRDANRRDRNRSSQNDAAKETPKEVSSETPQQ